MKRAVIITKHPAVITLKHPAIMALFNDYPLYIDQRRMSSFLPRSVQEADA